MFSTIHRQKKAEQLITESTERMGRIDEAFEEAKEKLVQTTSRLDAVRAHLSQKTLERFAKSLEKMRNEPPVELPPVAEEPFSARLHTLFERADLEPVEAPEVRGGKAGAFFSALLAVVITIAVALAIGAVGSGMPLSPDTFTDPLKLEEILVWLGGGAYDKAIGNPLFGLAALALAALAAWTIVWSIRMGRAAKRNLAAAESFRDAAEAYATKKEEYLHAAEELSEELEELEKILHTCDIYMQEYNATIRRILHTEGEDFSAFKPASQKSTHRAAECALSLLPLLNIAVVTSEGTPSAQLSDAIAHGERLVTALLEEKPLPTFGETATEESSEQEAIILQPPAAPQEEEQAKTEAPAQALSEESETKREA